MIDMFTFSLFTFLTTFLSIITAYFLFKILSREKTVGWMFVIVAVGCILFKQIMDIIFFLTQMEANTVELMSKIMILISIVYFLVGFGLIYFLKRLYFKDKT